MKSKKDYIEITVWISEDIASAYGLFLSNKLTDNEINIEVNRKFPKYYKWEKRKPFYFLYTLL